MTPDLDLLSDVEFLLRAVREMSADDIPKLSKEAGKLAVAISQHRAAGGWRPISDSIKDGRFVDLWVGGEFEGRRTNCYWGLPNHTCGEMGSLCDSEFHGMEPTWIDSTFNQPLSEDPTHYRDLPEPPHD